MKLTDIIAAFVFLIFIILILHIIIIIAIWVFIVRRIFGNDKIIVTGKRRYVFIEKTEVIFTTKIIRDFSFVEPAGWIKIFPDGSGTTLITINGKNKDGYAWDGCSPKFQIFDLIIGTPDGAISLSTGKPAAYYASMIHDALYQFRKSFNGKITRKQVDRIFLEELRKAKFQLVYLYYLAVRTFGWLYWNS